jgi:hypothetical protein
VVLCPEVAVPELSLLRGIWFWAMPLETNNAAAANMAEHFLISSFLSIPPLVLQANVEVFRAVSLPRAPRPGGPSSL